MKKYVLTVVLCTLFFPAGCRDSLANSTYVLRLPGVPESWEAVLGEPRWRVEWINSNGLKKTVTASKNDVIEICLPPRWISAVTAAPFWPEKGISAGIFKPAGAIFPFDADFSGVEKALALSWQGGVEAVLYWELARAAVLANGEGSVRQPQNFNWPRFRQLFDNFEGAAGAESLNEEVRSDPWLADWRNIAERTVQSGFDRRRLVPEARTQIKVSAGSGPWTGTSPFAARLFFEGESVFPARQAADTWVSAEGILRCNTEAWIFIKWE